MNLQQILVSEGFNKVYQILSKEVSIFEKRVETLLFIEYSDNSFRILKKNKKRITDIDILLNPIFEKVEEHFSKIEIKNSIKEKTFKVGASENGLRLFYIKDKSEIFNDSKKLKKYSKILKIEPLEYLYEKILNSKEKNHLIDTFINKESNLFGIFKDSKSTKYYSFNGSSDKTIPKDINVVIITDFINFFFKNEISIIYKSKERDARYIELMNKTIKSYFDSNLQKYDNIHFDNPNYTINKKYLSKDLLDLFDLDSNLIIVYKIIIGTFNKRIHPRGLYNEKDISNINKTINKINLKLKGLDFINSVHN